MTTLSDKEIDYLDVRSELDKGQDNIALDSSTMEWIRTIYYNDHWEYPQVLLYDGDFSSPKSYYLRYVNRRRETEEKEKTLEGPPLDPDKV